MKSTYFQHTTHTHTKYLGHMDILDRSMEERDGITEGEGRRDRLGEETSEEASKKLKNFIVENQFHYVVASP